ncbi:hypothetical protein GCM10023091_02880 [Ravibacter arvi]|uniref:Uncharacterized protein n=1 Tax=Ravibacter arvi TaxID=2051041 RepID=A0ABP8LMD6_9BACT
MGTLVKIFKIIGKIIGGILAAVVIITIAVSVFLFGLFKIRNISYTHVLEVTEEDRFVQGMYIPFEDMQSIRGFKISASGEAYQDCMLIVTYSNGRSSQYNSSSPTYRFFLPKGRMRIDEYSINFYNEQNVSVVVRGIDNDKEAMGNFRVKIR